MAIREFELCHGAALTKLVRSQKPVSLRLIETRATENWSTYTVDDKADLFISHCKSPRHLSRNGGGTSWHFVFNRNQLRQINSKTRKRKVFVALICKGSANGREGQICLLQPSEIEQLMDFDSTYQSLTVRQPSGRSRLRVVRDRTVKMNVPKSRFEKWVQADFVELRTG